MIYLDPEDDPVCCIFVLASPLSVDRLLPLLTPPDPGLGGLCGWCLGLWLSAIDVISDWNNRSNPLTTFVAVALVLDGRYISGFSLHWWWSIVGYGWCYLHRMIFCRFWIVRRSWNSVNSLYDRLAYTRVQMCMYDFLAYCCKRNIISVLV